MDTPTLRILNAVSSSIGESLSINQLTGCIKDTYGTAYYANIYQKLQELKKENILCIEPIGRSSSIKLNFQNYLLIDILAEMEIEKKLNFLTKRNYLLPFLAEIDNLSDSCAVKSISAINPIRNSKLNKLELLIILRKTPSSHNQAHELYRQMQKLQNKHNQKINSLIVDESDFLDLIASDEINPLREALSEQIAFFCPQAFWNTIKTSTEKTQIKTIKPETKPANISDADLAYNLNRFGYKEFGSTLTQGKRFCIEYIITAILLQENARQTEAIPVILAKNKHNSNLLAFLSQKFDTAGKLLGLLKTLQKLIPAPETENTIRLLKAFNTEEVSADQESIMQKMRLYNAL